MYVYTHTVYVTSILLNHGLFQRPGSKSVLLKEDSAEAARNACIRSTACSPHSGDESHFSVDRVQPPTWLITLKWLLFSSFWSLWKLAYLWSTLQSARQTHRVLEHAQLAGASAVSERKGTNTAHPMQIQMQWRVEIETQNENVTASDYDCDCPYSSQQTTWNTITPPIVFLTLLFLPSWTFAVQ